MLLSTCCKAEVWIESEFDVPFNFICSKCQEPCDVEEVEE